MISGAYGSLPHPNVWRTGQRIRRGDSPSHRIQQVMRNGRIDGSGREMLLQYHDSMLILRIVLHVAVFAAALLIFTLGLGVGLSLSSAAGTFLWLVAGVIAVGNIVWIVRRIRGRPDNGS